MEEFDEDGWAVTRSHIDRRVWVPLPVGFGEVAHALNAGSLRAVKRYVESQEMLDLEHMAWRKLDDDRWFLGWVG